MPRPTKAQRRKLKLRKRRPKPKLPGAQRRCGSCVACCTTMGTPELEKPHNVACEHVGTSCGIYDTRPRSCRAFECLWLQGHGRPEHRPDQLGITLDLTVKDGPLGRAGGVVIAREVSHGAASDPMVGVFLASLSKAMPVYLMCQDGRRAIWQDGQIKRTNAP